MNDQSIRATSLGALGAVLGLLLAAGPAAQAQATAAAMQTVIDRAEISDLLTRYYYNFGHASADSFSKFYTDDAELILGPKSYKGKAGIDDAYKGAGQANPATKAYSFTVLLTNPLVVVHGDAATARVIFTEIVIDTPGAPPRLLTQGREYDHLVKQSGEWRFTKRQIMPGAEEPPGWTD